MANDNPKPEGTSKKFTEYRVQENPISKVYNVADLSKPGHPAVATFDTEEEASIFAAAPDMYEALKVAKENLIGVRAYADELPIIVGKRLNEAIVTVEQALSKATKA
jgi:hypothetical protein